MIWTTKNWQAVGATYQETSDGWILWNYKGIEVYSEVA
jgi:hypothetical protein